MKSKLRTPKHKPKWFVPSCHYCNLSGHIRPSCFKYLNTLKRGMIINPPNSAKSRFAPKFKIDLKNNFS